MIKNSHNPFKKDADPDRLFNICKGKSCKKGTEDFLLNAESIGNEARKSVIQKCVKNPNQGKRKIRGAEGKIIKQH